MVSDRIVNALMVGSAACALVVTAGVVRKLTLDRPERPARVILPYGEPVPRWREYATEGHSRGPTAAPIVIVEFVDFQCPACRMFSSTLDSVAQHFPNEVRIVYRHFPLPGHLYARPAGIAAECAAGQNRFGEISRALYAGQAMFGTRPWREYAQDAGVPDLAAFTACLRDPSVEHAIRRDVTAGNALDIYSTPTFLLNGRLFRSAHVLGSMDTLVRAQLDSIRRPGTSEAMPRRQ